MAALLESGAPCCSYPAAPVWKRLARGHSTPAAPSRTPRADKLCFKSQQCSQRAQRLFVQAVTEASPSPQTSKGKKGKKGSDAVAPAGASSVSSGVKLENISITFKNQQVLKDVSWDVKKGEKVGLVGVNGAGKTTQLQIITGALQPDAGNVIKAKENMRIAYLTQEFDVTPSNTVREEFMSAFGEQVKLQRRQEALQTELEQCGDDMDKMAALLDEMEELNSNATDLDMTLLDRNIDKMMPELGFTPDDSDQLVAAYSGGWQMRMCLGKILLSEPDLLLLDEPTNHLDLDAIQWLEGYLQSQDVPMVVVSHDREFLDQLCNKLIETEHGVATTYKGNYTEYVKAKEEKIGHQWAAWEKQQREIARQTEIVQRLSGGAQSGRAAAAEKSLEKIKEEGSLVQKPFVTRKRSFAFPAVERMGQDVLSVQQLTHGYQDRTLFKNCNFEMEKSERVALIGPNGCGKSTLLRLVMGQEDPISGRVQLGPYNIVPAYFAQNQADALDLKQDVLQTMVKAAPDAQLNDVKALLGRMMFNGKAMEKKVDVLSGGEKARLALAKFMLTQGTFLVLDEPTNHLDIPSKEMLEEALMKFEGAVIAVSHDRYFLRKIATRVVTVVGQKLKDTKGGYAQFLRENKGEAKVMEEKEKRVKVLEQSTVKAKSKMSKADKARMKKDKAKSFNNAGPAKGASKNAKRWN